MMRPRPSDNRDLVCELLELLVQSAESVAPVADGSETPEAEAEFAAMRAQFQARLADFRSGPPIPDEAVIGLQWGLFQLFVDRTLIDNRLWAERIASTIDELHRITHARNRARAATAANRRSEVIALRAQGEKIDYIAAKVGISPRRVLEILPEEMKRRR